MRSGGRWNAPNSFPVIYFNADVDTAKANARRLLRDQLAGQPFSADDLDPSELPVLVLVDVPLQQYLDAVSSTGCSRNGLPATYPRDASGATVPWAICRPVGQQAWNETLPGIACISAAQGAPTHGEELPWFDRHEVELVVKAVRSFEDWYGSIDW
jgi:hypothetical protein